MMRLMIHDLELELLLLDGRHEFEFYRCAFVYYKTQESAQDCCMRTQHWQYWTTLGNMLSTAAFLTCIG